MYINNRMKGLHYILSFVIIFGALFARFSDKYSSLSKKDLEIASGAIQHELLPSEIEDNEFLARNLKKGLQDDKHHHANLGLNSL